MKIKIMHNMCSCPGNASLFQYKKYLVLMLKITHSYFSYLLVFH